LKRLSHNSYLKVFILGFFCAFCIFVSFLVMDKGFFLYAGDYNSQQIPFYMYMVNMVQQGKLNWSWATDLGSSFINSFSYYGLGSPFFWLSCLFPYKAAPYILPYFNMLKFAFTALGAFCFLRRYAKDDTYATVGAIVYAFSGFNVYNIFFQFLDAIAFFPFLLWSLDEFVYNKKRGLFVFFTAINLVTNYFFFVGEVVFLLIYFVCKIVSREYILKLKEFALLAFESVLGCLCGIILAVPSIAELLSNPRSTRFAEGFDMWIYSNAQRYFAIVMSAFYPPEVPYNINMFTDANVKWSSLSAFLVLGGMFGFFVFLKHFKKSAFTRVFICCIVFAFVPVLNSSFYAFNRNYYARWFYMPLLILAAMNMQSFAMDKKHIFDGLKTTALITLLFCIFALTPTTDDGVFKLGLQKITALFWLNFLVAAGSLYITFVIVHNFIGKPEYPRMLLLASLSCITVFSIVHISLVKLPQTDNDADYKAENYDTVQLMGEFDFSDCRIDAYKSYINLGMYWDKPCIQFFSSTVNPSIMEFYPYVGVKRTVSSKPEQENYALRSLLSVKYLFVPENEYDSFTDNDYDKTYREHCSSGPFKVLKNRYFIPMGFTYDYYVTESQLNNVETKNRSNILLRGLLLNENLVDFYKLPLEKLNDSSLEDISFDTYVKDVQDRILSASHYFEQTKDGFVSEIYLDKANLVFYSVPYDKGFTAFVNGAESEVIKVNNGLCAVYAPAGECEIVFSYRTPYLNLGIFLNLLGLGIYIVYLIFILKKKVKI